MRYPFHFTTTFTTPQDITLSRSTSLQLHHSPTSLSFPQLFLHPIQPPKHKPILKTRTLRPPLLLPQPLSLLLTHRQMVSVLLLYPELPQTSPQLALCPILDSLMERLQVYADEIGIVTFALTYFIRFYFVSVEI